ncbi:NACHT domain-containing protein [Trichoderma breve]|uniref:NACHT domain-containing protein n=1 Tax=Trichoderma breve TaxID=2034170 RepID=A0A9W9B3J3_9HYPO|nr:NACHT domain-containing protein [Trichoderma breve]KAJ4855338.1 NACHT domain-containing protein [Trichoderma breve]
MANVREISGNTIGNNVTIVQGDLNTANPRSPDSIDAFLNKISKTDPFYDKKRILELKGPLLHESFNWILDHEGFKKWRHTEESSVLWIKGDPGKGKTMLLCGIIEDLEKTPGEKSKLGYFFCQATDSRINSASSVVAGLIFSLVRQNPTLFSPICKRHEDKLSQLDGPNAWPVLTPICVVDALDECEHDYIERGLRLIEPARRLSLELKENAENVSKSVDVYINNFISVTTLKRKANGTFLWVALVIEQLRDTDRRNVEEVLEEIPEGLENLYNLILQRANAKLRKKDREACQILLSIVTTAERPLHLEELHIFITIRDDIVYFIHHIFPSGIQYQHRKMFETSISAMSRIFRQDIYNLKDPERCMGNIRPPHPDPLVPIKYSCVFWVDHLIRGYDSEGFKSEECFKDDGQLQAFLKTKYLCWLEALALLRSLIPEGESALQRLNNQAASYCKSRENGHRLIGDAYRFFHYCQNFVREWPLQLYYSALLYSPNSSTICMFYNSISLYRTDTVERAIRLNVDETCHHYVSFLPDSEHLVSVSHKGLVQTWAIDSGIQVQQLSLNLDISKSHPDHPSEVFREEVVSLSPHGDLAASMFRGSMFGQSSFKYLSSMKIWTTKSGACTREIDLMHTPSFRDLYVFAPNSALIALIHKSDAITYSIWTGKIVKHICTQSSDPLTWSFAISPGSKYVAERGLEGYINIWSGKGGECIQALKYSYSDEWARPVFSPNLEYVACADGNRRDVRIWRLTTGEPLHLLESHSASCKLGTIIFSEDSKHLVAGYDNGEARVWCAETGKCLFKSDENNDDSNNDDSNNDDSNNDDSNIDDSNTDDDYDDPYIVALAISPESKYMARASTWTSERGSRSVWGVRIWDWRAGHHLSSFGSEQSWQERSHFCADSLRFSSDATILAVILQLPRGGSDDGGPEYEAQIWEVATGTFITSVAVGTVLVSAQDPHGNTGKKFHGGHTRYGNPF